MGENYDINTFYHMLSVQYPNHVQLVDYGNSMELRILVSRDANAEGCTIADSEHLCEFNEVHVKNITWQEVTQSDILRAEQHVWKWLYDRIGPTKASNGFENLPKINYSKCRLGSLCVEAYCSAHTLAAFLDNSKDYLSEFFSDTEFAQGIRFLLKLNAIRK